MFVERNELCFCFLSKTIVFMIEIQLLLKSFVKFWLFLVLLRTSGTEEVVPTKSSFSLEHVNL